MGVYIKNMKMPKDDETIKFVKLLNGKIVAVTSPTKGVGDIHEVIEVAEPHGRLIDADVIMNALPKEYLGSSVHGAINNAPAVIESEGE